MEIGITSDRSWANQSFMSDAIETRKHTRCQFKLFEANFSEALQLSTQLCATAAGNR